MSPRAVSAVESGSRDQDRVLCQHLAGSWLLVLADGVGGRSGGREAAEGAIRFVRERAQDLASGRLSCVEALRQVDIALAEDKEAGETTVVLALVQGGEVVGASLGDSGAWLIVNEQSGVDLTRDQVRKPMAGSGGSFPVPFGPLPQRGRLLLASDGLLKYASAEGIRTTALSGSLEVSAKALIETVRYPSGGLPDDVSVVLHGE